MAVSAAWGLPPPSLGFRLQVTNPIPHWRTRQGQGGRLPHSPTVLPRAVGAEDLLIPCCGGSPSLCHVQDCELGSLQE